MFGVNNLCWIALVSFVYVFLRAFQQLNVMHGNKPWILVVSVLMAYTDVFLVSSYARTGPGLLLGAVVGVASGLGCLASMLASEVLFGSKKEST